MDGLKEKTLYVMKTKQDVWIIVLLPLILSGIALWGVSIMPMPFNPHFLLVIPIGLTIILFVALKWLSEPDENLSVTLRHDPPRSISLNGGDIRLLFDYRNNREAGKIKMLYYNTYVLFNSNLLQDSLLRDNLQIEVAPRGSGTHDKWKKKEMPGCYGMTKTGTYKFILIIIYAVDNKTFTAHDMHSVEVVP